MGGYNAMLDFFPTMSMKPNPHCDEYHCLKRQEQRAKELADQPEIDLETEEEEAVVHEDNEWGISLVDQEVATGISTAYSYKAPAMEDVPDDDVKNEDEGESLEEPMAKMGKL